MVDLTRPIVGIENRSAQEVFDIMVDRFKRQTPPVNHVVGSHPACCVEEWYEGDEVSYLRDKLKQAIERDRFYGVRITTAVILREWFGGERYARDHEYLDANYSNQAQQVVDWLASLAPSPAPRAKT